MITRQYKWKDGDHGPPIKWHRGATVIYLVGVYSTKRHDFNFLHKNRSNIPVDNGSPFNTLMIKPTKRIINITIIKYTT